MIFQIMRVLKRIGSGAKLLKVSILTLSILAYSSTGFMYFELSEKPDLAWADAFWWSIVTMTTVGYGDLFPTSVGGRYLVGVPTMIFGVAILGYLLSTVANYLIETRTLGAKGMANLELEGNILIIHFQTLDRQMALLDELETKKVVLIDDQLETLPTELAERGVKFVRGNATKEATLERANFKKATRAILLAKDANEPGSDNHNLAASLVLEQLHPGIISVAECIDPEHISLLYKAGCDSVVCPAELSSGLLVTESLAPGLAEVVRQMTTSDNQTLYVGEVKSLSDQRFAAVRSKMNEKKYLTIGFRRGKHVALNPGDDEKVEVGDLLVCIGKRPPGPLTL